MNYSDFIEANPENVANSIVTGLSTLAGCGIQNAHQALLKVNPAVTVVDNVPLLAVTENLPAVLRAIGELCSNR